jgi:hypothetical protein
MGKPELDNLLKIGGLPLVEPRGQRCPCPVGARASVRTTVAAQVLS